MKQNLIYIEYLLIILTAVTFLIPEFKSIDQSFSEFLYLSSIQLLTSIYILFFRSKELKIIYSNRSILMFLLFIVVSLFSIFNSVNIELSIIELIHFFVFLITLINLTILIKFKKENYFYILIICLLTLESFKVIYEFWKRFDFDNPLLRSPYYAGFSANVNVTAFSILIKLPILIGFYIKGDFKNYIIKCYFYILHFCSFFAIFLCYSRGAILSTFLLFIFLLISSIISKKTRVILTFGLISIASFYTHKYLFINSESNILKRVSTYDFDDESSSFNYRLGYYTDALKGINEKPFLGHGIGNWKIISLKYARDRIKEYQVPYHVHNDFLQMIVEVGVFGGVLYILIFCWPLYFLIIKSRNKLFILNESSFILILCLLIYLIDANLNFPRVRPTSVINICMMIAFSYSLVLKAHDK